METTTVVDSYQLSPLQQGMIFHRLHAATVGVDIEQMVGELDEPIDTPTLEQAWRQVVARHAILRTQFRWIGLDEPVQDVLSGVESPLRIVDLRPMSGADQSQLFAEYLEGDRIAGFELDCAPLWRITLFRLDDDRSRLVLTYHHALLDTSVVWCIQELFQCYDALRGGTVPTFEERRPYRDHIGWLQEHLRDNREAAKQYFQQLLAGIEGPTRLDALERPGPPTATYGALRFALSEDISRALHALGTELGNGAPAVVEAVWALVLSSFSGSSDVVFGSTRGCRRSGLAGSDTMMGLLINTTPVRVSLEPTLSVRELLSTVRAQQVAKRAYEHTPLTDVQAAVHSHGAGLFDTIVVINELHQGTRLKRVGDAFATRQFDLHDQTNFALTLLAYLDPSTHFKLSFDRSRFDDASIERVRQLFVEILEAVVATPDLPLNQLVSVSAGERGLLAAWNSTRSEYPAQSCIHELFEAQVERTPDAIALVFREAQITYRELNTRANSVAAQLTTLGVGPDVLVGVFVERSVEMMIGLLGVLKAGGAYVPMDPKYPHARIAMMLEDAHVSVVLTQKRLRGSLPTTVAHVVVLDSSDPIHTVHSPPIVAGLNSEHLAYVIFTSGSTGRPKGVMVEHRNVVNFFTAMDEALGHDSSQPPGTWLAVTSISFDISVLELFWTLTRGFTVVLQQDERTLAGTTPTTESVMRPMSFSLFYFAADASSAPNDRYRLLIEGARFADGHDFAAVWTPERHFHPFGGLYPNPALTSAAVAMVTSRIAIRAGSVVLPLHNPIQCAEDWSVVDNLSNGRVGLSFASGWHADDFALSPDNFADRRRLMAEGIDTIQTLWRGGTVTARSGDGRDISVGIYPPPIQADPPIWITAGGSPETFAMAGRLGANILTNLLVMDRDDLAGNIAVYRDAYRSAGHSGQGSVTLMLHTFVGAVTQQVHSMVRKPLLDYLRTSTDLISRVRWEQTSFAKPASGGGGTSQERGLDDLSDDDMNAMMEHAFERYLHSAGLFGAPDDCVAMVDGLSDLGVDEIACLIDFGLDTDTVLDGLGHLDRLRRHYVLEPPDGSDAGSDSGSDYALVSQVARHGVTHLQGTPSLAQVIAATPEGLDALASLNMLLLGGEALPDAVVDRVLPALSGVLLNMYGPTETTIWSTVSRIHEAGAPITIGRPVANTQVHIVDRHLRPLPIGVAGELLIGGAGVVRGYLDRPDLTNERFVNLPFAPGRLYRTGDLARILPNGEIEFSGRLDNQVKIRGYRIELGEIEAAIGRHPDVAETVVIARTDSPAEPHLVAYVVPRAVASSSVASSTVADDWGRIWDDTYQRANAIDATFDVAGWNSSYTGQPIPLSDMRAWVDHTVARIMALSPSRVLEIGCGTGLLLYRVAPTCDLYVGLDAAASALDRITDRLTLNPMPQVSLVHGQAHELTELVSSTFDTIIINSVAQYFPDADYLIDVVTQARALLSPGGALFVGDLRSLAHLPMFAAGVELERSPAELAWTELGHRATKRVGADTELVVDPELFAALPSVGSEGDSIQVLLKSGPVDNELTCFRYDVVLRRAHDAEQADASYNHAVTERVLNGETYDMDHVLDAIVGEPTVTRIRGLLNARIVPHARLVQLLAQPDVVQTVAEGRLALHSERAELAGLHPDTVIAGVQADGRYVAEATWSTTGPDRFDLLLRPLHAPPFRMRPPPVPKAWSLYTNRPQANGRATIQSTPHESVTADLETELRSSLRAQLPDFMIPSVFVMMDELPRTPNAKIDRNNLPAPDRARHNTDAVLVLAATEVEQIVARIWEELLSLDTVSVETNLFDLGANSLMMVRASTRLSDALDRPVTLVDMFRYPTVRSLATNVLWRDTTESDTTESHTARQQGQDRAQLRRDAMRRQRARPGRPDQS